MAFRHDYMTSENLRRHIVSLEAELIEARDTLRRRDRDAASDAPLDALRTIAEGSCECLGWPPYCAACAARQALRAAVTADVDAAKAGRR